MEDDNQGREYFQQRCSNIDYSGDLTSEDALVEVAEHPQETIVPNPSTSLSKRNLIKTQQQIFCFFLYNYKFKFLPNLKTKLLEQTENLSDEVATSFSEKISQVTNESYFKYDVANVLTDEMKSIPCSEYSGRCWPAIHFYTSHGTPESTLFRKFMVPQGGVDKLRHDMQYGVVAYHFLFREIVCLARMHPDKLVKEATLHRFELWDIDKFCFYWKEVQELPVLDREYKENCLLFSTTNKKSIANLFSKRKSGCIPCRLEYQVVSLDKDLLCQYQQTFPDVLLWKECCVDISDVSVYKSEKEALLCDSVTKKITSIDDNSSSNDETTIRNVKIAMTNVASMFQTEKMLRMKEKVIFDGISHLAILKHLANRPDECQQEGIDCQLKSLNENLETLFSQIELQTAILHSMGYDEIQANRMAIEQIWHKMCFYDHIIKPLDTPLCVLLQRLEKNLPHLLAECKTYFQLSIGPIVVDLLRGLQTYFDNKNDVMLRTIVMDCYRRFSEVADIEMSISTADENLSEEHLLMDITNGFVQLTAFLESKNEAALIGKIFDCTLEAVEKMLHQAGEYEKYKDKLQSGKDNFKPGMINYFLQMTFNSTDVIGDYEKNFNPLSLMSSLGYPSENGEGYFSNITKTLKSVLELLELFKDTTQSRYKEQGITKAKQNICQLVLDIFPNIPWKMIEEDVDQWVHTVFCSPPRLSNDWLDPILHFQDEDYRRYLNQPEAYLCDADTDGTIQRLLLSLFACGLINMGDEEEKKWGRYGYLKEKYL